MNNVVEFVFAILFAFLLSVALCEESIEVPVDNTPVEVGTDVIF